MSEAKIHGYGNVDLEGVPRHSGDPRYGEEREERSLLGLTSCAHEGNQGSVSRKAENRVARTSLEFDTQEQRVVGHTTDRVERCRNGRT